MFYLKKEKIARIIFFFLNAGNGYKVADHFCVGRILNVFMKVTFKPAVISVGEMRTVMWVDRGDTKVGKQRALIRK